MGEKKANDHQFYDYIIEKPGLIVGLFTLSISTTAIVVHFFPNVFLSQFLSYWGFSSDFIKLPEHSVFSLSFFQQFGFFIFNSFFVAKVDTLISLRKTASSIISYFTAVVEDLKKAEEGNDGDEKKQQLQKSNEVISAYKIVREKCSYRIIRLMLFTALINFLLIPMAFNGGIMLEPLPNYLKYSLYLLGSILITLSYYLISVFTNKTKRKDAEPTSTKVKEALKAFDSLLEKDSALAFNNHPMEDRLNDFKIKSILCCYLLTIITLFVADYFLAPVIIGHNKRYEVVEIDSEPYVLLYQNDNQSFLNEMTIIDNDAYISSSAHRIIYGNDISFNSMKFDNVYKCEVIPDSGLLLESDIDNDNESDLTNTE